ncbi:MAG: outer membrane protein assembly factor BamD [Verrucomicrobiales bacterium]|nr:outer membrane protein assembly factor BamD [Verrucomicrobiales bacterium]MCP5527472.1 outer membrane protein assembly factor BamD [Verrucomicrobiales bacterium]
MKRTLAHVLLAAVGVFLLPVRTPAPLIYRPGEGWVYESPGGAQWHRSRAADQLAVAEEAYANQDYKLATKAARRTVARWPQSDYAADAQSLVGRSYEARHKDEKAFKELQKVVDKHPKYRGFDDVVVRQFEIANRFLAGQWFKLWGVIPFFSSMEKTADLYEKLIRNGPYSRVAPFAQLNIGIAREKQKEYALAVRAYEKAADLYGESPVFAAEALHRAGMAWYRQARTAEYDQSAAGNAIATFTDFIILYPADPRVPEARALIDALKREQARGAYRIARYYEKRRKPDGARVYYNEVVRTAPDSEYAAAARERLAALKKRAETP